MKTSTQRGNILIALLLFVVLAVGAFFLFKPKLPSNQIQPYTQPQAEKQGKAKADLQKYTSKDLKISFNYPQDWYIEEGYPFILIASFQTSFQKDITPKENQIEIIIKEFSGCFPTLEEDLIDPACGQGEVENKIISKDVRQTPGGEFLKYTLDSYDENQKIQYFFQKDGKILDIEKRPDPSQFEKEFEEIVNSIRFL